MAQDVTIKLSDGVNEVLTKIDDSSGFIEVELQLNVSNFANNLIISIQTLEPDKVIEIHKIYSNKGQVAIEALPCIVEGHIGEIKTYIHTDKPHQGELELNGEPLTNDYTRLNSIIHKKFGYDNVSGNSKLPDMGGLFERNIAHGSDNDPDAALRTDRGDGVDGDNIGTLQSDAIRNIIAEWRTNLNGTRAPLWAADVRGAFYQIDVGNVGRLDTTTSTDSIRGLGFDSSLVVPTGGDNRPKNIYVFKTIKYC